MEARARAMPGFIDFKTFAAPDGERVSLVTFASRSEHEAWREDPAHQEAQRRGQQDFYEEYSIVTAEGPRSHSWQKGHTPL
jgi:heme-degrading monooxygenase HmoA